MPYTPEPLLIGSTFPLSLVRRSVHIEIQSLGALAKALTERPIFSFWRHENTLSIVNRLLGTQIPPADSGMAITLDEENYPVFHGHVFTQCWVLSPDYETGYRPEADSEAPLDKIRGWHVLRLSW